LNRDLNAWSGIRMHGFTPEEVRLETLQRRIYSLFNTDDELQNYVRGLDNRWAIARKLAKELLEDTRSCTAVDG
jgi:hypothetical protein